MKIFKKNEVIFKEGEQAGAVFLLCKGKVVLAKKKENNAYSLIEILQAGEMLGLPAVLSDVAYTTSAIAKSKVYCFKVFKDELLQFLRDHPCFYLSVAEKLSTKLLFYESVLSV